MRVECDAAGGRHPEKRHGRCFMTGIRRTEKGFMVGERCFTTGMRSKRGR